MLRGLFTARIRGQEGQENPAWHRHGKRIKVIQTMKLEAVHRLPNTAMIKPKKQANKEIVHPCSELHTRKENHIPPFS